MPTNTKTRGMLEDLKKHECTIEEIGGSVLAFCYPQIRICSFFGILLK